MDTTTTYQQPAPANLNPATASTKQLWGGLSVVTVFSVLLAIICVIGFAIVRGVIYLYGLFAMVSTSWQFIAGIAVGAVIAIVPQVISWKTKQ